LSNVISSNVISSNVISSNVISSNVISSMGSGLGLITKEIKKITEIVTAPMKLFL